MNGRLNYATRGVLALAAAAAGLAAASSCTQDFDQFFQGETTTATGTGGVGGSGGSAGECSVPDDCTGTDTTCQQRTCTNEVCGTSFANAGTACTEDSGAVCDGAGQCVECTNENHCEGGEVCEDNSCIPAACTNGELDGEETDLDCGGPDCSPCANTELCVLARDCESGFCDSDSGSGGAGGGGGSSPGGSVCAPCTADPDCSGATGTWCNTNVDGGTCVDKTVDGGACSGANQCQSGFCPPGDNVCCDSLCQATCQACVQAKTGTADGTCDYVNAGTDPDAECTAADPSTCGAAGQGCDGSANSCILYDSSTVCVAETCVNRTLYSDRLCDGGGVCTTGTSNQCPNGYLCNSTNTACLTDCSANGNADCASDHWCDTTDDTCQPDKVDGQPCSTGLECQNGSCPWPDNVCCDTSCSRDCESCLNADHGGGDGTCLPIATGQPDPGGNCDTVVAPCGGELCNGSSSAPACEAVCDPCTTLYPPSHAAIYSNCSDTATECRMGVNTNVADCNTICASGGGECVGYYNNAGACNTGTEYNCDTTGYSTSICICSHGCGSGPPCTGGQTCSGGTCS